MATVHPSRIGLVPQDRKDLHSDRRRGRSPSPPRRHDRDHREYDRDRDRDRYRESDRERTYSTRDRPSPRKKDEERERSRGEDRERGRDGKRGTDRDADRDKDTDRGRNGRRASPEYGEYKRPASPAPGARNMYPSRQPRDEIAERDRPPHIRVEYGGGGGSDFLESRRLQRENSTLNIWPPSPKAAARALSPERGSSRRKSKRNRSETPSDISDSDSERRRREPKERKRSRKEKERKERKHREERRRKSRSYNDSEEDEGSREREQVRRSKSKSRARSPSPSRTPSPAEGEEEWVEKPAPAIPFVATSQSNGTMPPPAIIPRHSMKHTADDDDSDDELGPQPLQKVTTSKKVDERAYGGALLRGEGSAMAAFLQEDTDSRIPRRGEIGLTSDEIAQFESVGYVMSGSRHKRMNAVRMRKENQVISAEEKRGILKLQRDERERREAILREEFSELVSERLKAPEAKPK
ncbi:ras-induced vulval development antagonist-domain-containing protein [Melanogaster broomeanus]|nr:ras-induced vulval development antagonist-domain-containing protein [Melanogaster broomeanus]